MNIIVFNITHSMNYPPPYTPTPPTFPLTVAACRRRFFFPEKTRPWNFGHAKVSKWVKMSQNGSKWVKVGQNGSKWVKIVLSVSSVCCCYLNLFVWGGGIMWVTWVSAGVFVVSASSLPPDAAQSWKCNTVGAWRQEHLPAFHIIYIYIYIYIYMTHARDP